MLLPKRSFLYILLSNNFFNGDTACLYMDIFFYLHLINNILNGVTLHVYSWDTRPKSSFSSCSRCPGESLGDRAYFWDLLEDAESQGGKSVEAAATQLYSYSDLMFKQAMEGGKGGGNSSSRGYETNPKTRKNKLWKPTQSGLSLNPVLASDAGDYLCRVDFKSTPTKNSFIQLKVLGMLNKFTR